MRNLGFILLISLTVGLSASGQDNPVAEFDLYGRWVLEFDENGRLSKKMVYI